MVKRPVGDSDSEFPSRPKYDTKCHSLTHRLAQLFKWGLLCPHHGQPISSPCGLTLWLFSAPTAVDRPSQGLVFPQPFPTQGVVWNEQQSCLSLQGLDGSLT